MRNSKAYRSRIRHILSTGTGHLARLVLDLLDDPESLLMTLHVIEALVRLLVG